LGSLHRSLSAIAMSVRTKSWATALSTFLHN